MLRVTEYGAEYDNCSEDWRRYCEALHALRLPDKVTKRSAKGETVTKALYLSRVEQARGEQARHTLREEMLKIWNHRKLQSPKSRA
jgi:hypothetical protein